MVRRPHAGDARAVDGFPTVEGYVPNRRSSRTRGATYLMSWCNAIPGQAVH
jgi:hypothetical protein